MGRDAGSKGNDGGLRTCRWALWGPIFSQGQLPHQLQRLTDHPAPDYSPCWHPNGKFIAFVSERVAGRQIWLLDIESKRVRKLTKTGNNWAPSFSPDGRWIAFISDRAGQPHVWVARTDYTDAEPRQLTKYHEDSPAWDPNGSVIAFVSRRTAKSSLWVMNPLAGGKPTQLTDLRRQTREPALSRDGRYLAFVSDISGNLDIWLMETPSSMWVSVKK